MVVLSTVTLAQFDTEIANSMPHSESIPSFSGALWPSALSQIDPPPHHHHYPALRTRISHPAAINFTFFLNFLLQLSLIFSWSASFSRLPSLFSILHQLLKPYFYQSIGGCSEAAPNAPLLCSVLRDKLTAHWGQKRDRAGASAEMRARRVGGWQHGRTDKIDRARKTAMNGTDCGCLCVRTCEEQR